MFDKLIDKLAEIILDNGKVWAFVSTFFIFGIAAFICYLFVASPIYFFGSKDLSWLVSGAIGCGLGAGLVNGIGMALHA